MERMRRYRRLRPVWIASLLLLAGCAAAGADPRDACGRGEVCHGNHHHHHARHHHGGHYGGAAAHGDTAAEHPAQP